MNIARNPSLLAMLRGFTFMALLGLLGASQAQSFQPRLMDPQLLAGLIEEELQLPYILYVGPKPLFEQGHIPHSLYVGPTSIEEGMGQLEGVVRNIPRDASIVVYCGCCAWDICPNLPPVEKKLAALGFTNVKFLDLPTNLTMDWTNKNYPLKKGPAPKLPGQQ